MVLESGIPELEDIESLLSANWNQVQRTYLDSAFNHVVLTLMDMQRGAQTWSKDNIRYLRNQISNLSYVVGLEHEALILYMKDQVIPKIIGKVSDEAIATRAQIWALDFKTPINAIPGKVWAEKPWFDSQWALIYQNTTKNYYEDAPTTETLRGMVSKIRWELLIGSRDKEKGLFSGIIGDLTAIPGAVVTGLAGSFKESTKAITEAAVASQEAIWGLFEESQQLLGESVSNVFGDFFQVGGPLLGIMSGIPMAVGKMMFGAQDDIAGMFLSTLRTSSPANIEDFKNYVDTETTEKGFWPKLQEYPKADPDTIFAVAQSLRNGMGTQMIMATCMSVLAETILPYQSGIAGAMPSLWETLIGAKEVIGAFTGPILSAAMETPMRQYANRRWLGEIPGPADLISMYVKEGFEPFKQMYVPADFAENMKLHGYDAKWTNAWWGAHWVLPPINLLYEFYHRKLEGFDRSKLEQYLRWHDYHPDEHKWLIEAAETLIPRIDIRRGLDYGKITPEEVPGLYEKLGYSPANAKVMAGIAERYSLTAERSDLRRLYERRFLLRFIEEPEFRTALAGLEFGTGVIEERTKYILLRRSTDEEVRAGKISEEVRIKELTVSQLGRALKYGRIPETEYNERLAEYGYTDADINVLRDRILEDPVVDAQESFEREIVRTKTRTYRTLYAAEAIDRTKFETNLLAIGVGEELVFALADFEDAKKVEIPEETETAEDRALGRRIREMKGRTAREQYKRWQISVEDLTDALQSYDYDVDEARAIAGYEEIRRPAAPVPEELVEDEKRRLELQRLKGQTAREKFRDGIIDKGALETELRVIGYHDEISRAMANLEEARLPVPALTEAEKDMARTEARAKRLRETAVRTLYRTWIITEEDLRECLLAIPLDSSVAQSIIDLERARRPDEPIPPEEMERLKHVAEVRRWQTKVSREKYRKHEITDMELYAELVAAGYTEDVAWLIREYEVVHRLPKPK